MLGNLNLNFLLFQLVILNLRHWLSHLNLNYLLFYRVILNLRHWLSHLKINRHNDILYFHLMLLFLLKIDFLLYNQILKLNPFLHFCHIIILLFLDPFHNQNQLFHHLFHIEILNLPLLILLYFDASYRYM